MSIQRILVAEFTHEDDLLHAIEAVRRRGLRIVDAFTPYAVHGIDRALGLRQSRLTWVCFFCAMTGALGMLCFEHWSAARSWAINVGGKPWNSLPSDVPVAFEAAVLSAGFGTVFALLGVSRLFPGKKAAPIRRRVTDDRFVLVLEETDAAFDVRAVQQLLRESHAVNVAEQLADGGELSL